MRDISPQVWPTVLAEMSRSWLRRQRIVMLTLVLAVLAAAIAASLGRTNQSQQLLMSVAAYAPVIAGLMVMSGLVSGDIASRMMLLWFQKPGVLFRAYLIRYTVQLALLVALTLALGATVGTIGLVSGLFDPGRIARLLVLMLTLALLPSALVFAFSAWGVRRDALAAATFMLTSLVVASSMAFNHSASARVIKTLLFPIDAIAAMADTGSIPSVEHARLIVAAHFLAWFGLALIGLKLTEHSLPRA